LSNRIIYVMGVSGCGKSTIGKLIANELGIQFFDGDDFHPQANIEKMKSGQALNDDDRRPWLEAINTHAKNISLTGGAVIACSALKESYREKLSADIVENTIWVYLKGSFNLIQSRMMRRSHFMPSSLLQSQFDTLQEPSNAIIVSIKDRPELVSANIIKQLEEWQSLD